MVNCYTCKGKGYTLFYGKESTCRPCAGNGELVVCKQYSLMENALIGFRNQPCHNCGVKPADHITTGVKS